MTDIPIKNSNYHDPNNNLYMTVINYCQNEISCLDSHKHYKKYKAEEVLYWSNIPKWIYENKNVNNCLDIGCAYGTLTLFCKKVFNCPVYCTDFIDEFISSSLIKKYNLVFQVNNIELDPFPWDISFDIIILTEVLEHFNFNPIPTFTRIRNLLSANGKLYLSTPDAEKWGKETKYYQSMDDMPYPSKDLPIIDAHIYLYNLEELKKIFNLSGLNIQKFDYSPGLANRHFNFVLEKS